MERKYRIREEKNFTGIHAVYILRILEVKTIILKQKIATELISLFLFI